MKKTIRITKNVKRIIEIDQYHTYNGNTNNSNISTNYNYISKNNIKTFK